MMMGILSFRLHPPASCQSDLIFSEDGLGHRETLYHHNRIFGLPQTYAHRVAFCRAKKRSTFVLLNDLDLAIDVFSGSPNDIIGRRLKKPYGIRHTTNIIQPFW